MKNAPHIRSQPDCRSDRGNFQVVFHTQISKSRRPGEGQCGGELSPVRAGGLSPVRAGGLSPVRAGELSPVRAGELSPVRAGVEPRAGGGLITRNPAST
jgi:hypothetical protein